MTGFPNAIHGDARHYHVGGAADTEVRDPVCGMSVDPAAAKHRLSHGDHDHFLCGAGGARV
jgi:Cu+-exporting ATPase